MTPTAVIERAPTSYSGVRRGMADMAPAALGLIPFATMIGVAIVEGRVSDLTGYLGGVLVAGGSAHLAVIGAIDVGAGLLAAVVTAVLIQARGLAYGMALAPKLAGQPRWFRWIASYMLVDQVFVLADAAAHEEPRWFRQYYLSGAALLWVTYFGGLLVGMVLGPVIPESSPLPVVIPMMFAAMLGPTLTSARSVVAAAVAVVTIFTLGPVLPEGAGMVVAMIAGTAAGVATGRILRD